MIMELALPSRCFSPFFLVGDCAGGLLCREPRIGLGVGPAHEAGNRSTPNEQSAEPWPEAGPTDAAGWSAGDPEAGTTADPKAGPRRPAWRRRPKSAALRICANASNPGFGRGSCLIW